MKISAGRREANAEKRENRIVALMEAGESFVTSNNHCCVRGSISPRISNVAELVGRAQQIDGARLEKVEFEYSASLIISYHRHYRAKTKPKIDRKKTEVGAEARRADKTLQARLRWWTPRRASQSLHTHRVGADFSFASDDVSVLRCAATSARRAQEGQHGRASGVGRPRPGLREEVFHGARWWETPAAHAAHEDERDTDNRAVGSRTSWTNTTDAAQQGGVARGPRWDGTGRGVEIVLAGPRAISRGRRGGWLPFDDHRTAARPGRSLSAASACAPSIDSWKPSPPHSAAE